MISRAGANSGVSYIHDAGDGHVFAGFLVRYNFNNSKILNKYFYYWTKSMYYINQIAGVSKSGSTMPKLNPPVVGSLTIKLPTIEVQQEIIDIIKPIEDSITNIQRQIEVIKQLLVNMYNTCDTEPIQFVNIIKNENRKYNGQTKYLATNAVGECSIDQMKVQHLIDERPSRANLTPAPKSIIFSKLDGDNKVLFIDNKFQYVISTGFFNIKTEYLDHVMGFLLSNDFKTQKRLLSTGTTMVGLTNSSIGKLTISKPENNSYNLVHILNELLTIELRLKAELQKCITLLIK